MSDVSDDDWTVVELDQLGVLAYSGVEGVEVDEVGVGDDVAGHGVNAPEEQS